MANNVKPIKAKLMGGNLDSLAEFEVGDVISVENGGTGTSTLPSGEVLVGNGTSAVSGVSRGDLLSGSNKLVITGGVGSLVGANVTIDVDEASIDLSKTSGAVELSRVILQEPGTVDAQYTYANLATTDVPDENGDMVYDGSTF